MKRFIAALAVLIALVIVTAASAAPKAASGSISGPNEAGSPYNYGDLVTFTTATSGLKGNAYPMVSVRCFQDTNGDGLVLTPFVIVNGQRVANPDFVWLSLQQPDTAFNLGGGSSALDPSQPSTCVATLFTYSWKGGQETIVELDSVQFAVEP